jgi:hypothetical protein
MKQMKRRFIICLKNGSNVEACISKLKNIGIDIVSQNNMFSNIIVISTDKEESLTELDFVESISRDIQF